MGVKVLVCFMLIAITCRYSLAIKCNVPQVPGMAMDCADKEMGTFHEDVCMVQVIGTSNASQVASGCMAKQAPLSSCGTNMNVGDKNIKLCCCKSDQCNDDAFIKACREGTAPTSHPPVFSCYMSVQMGANTDDKSPISGSAACSMSNVPMLNKCIYMKAVTGNQTVISKSCVPDDGAAVNRCGQKMNMGGQQMISCCCDGSNCNDDAFAAKCLGGNDAGKPPLVVGTTAAAPQTTAPTQEPTAKETTTTMQADEDYSPGSASTEKVSFIILALSVIFYALMS